MKKTYQTPAWEFVPMQTTDIVTASGDNFMKEENLFGLFSE